MSLDHATILLASAYADTTRLLADTLSADGHKPIVRTTAGGATTTLSADSPDLAIVWLELPDALGAFNVVRTIRGASRLESGIDPLTPLIAIDPNAGEFSCLRAFELGCDDYLSGACSTLELRARIAALLRRTCMRIDQGRIEVGALEIDSNAHEARFGNVELTLSRKEFALLRELASQPNRVFTKAELLRSVWGYRSLVHTRTLDTHASRLRRKLAKAGATTDIRTIWGVGYRLNASTTATAA